VSSQLGIILDCFVNYAINAVKCHKIDNKYDAKHKQVFELT